MYFVIVYSRVQLTCLSFFNSLFINRNLVIPKVFAVLMISCSFYDFLFNTLL